MSGIDFINIDPSSNLDQSTFDFGNGYIKFTDSYFDEVTNYYKVTGEVLDENHSMIGNLVANGHLDAFHLDDYKLSVKYDVEVSLEGDIKNILSLSKNI